MTNLEKRELIGVEIEITNSKNRDDIGKIGKMIDETRNTIIIETIKGERKSFLKSNIELRLLNTDQIIQGKNIIGRPEERIRK